MSKELVLKDILSEKQVSKIIYDNCAVTDHRFNNISGLDKAIEALLSLPIDVKMIDEGEILKELKTLSTYHCNRSIGRQFAKLIADKFVKPQREKEEMSVDCTDCALYKTKEVPKEVLEALDIPELAVCDYGDTNKIVDHLIVIAHKTNELIEYIKKER